MIEVSQGEFDAAINHGIANLPEPYRGKIQNTAFIAEDEVSADKFRQLKLSPNGLLFGLYEGVSLPRRGGRTDYPPDKITIYKKPHELVSRDIDDFRQKVGHTVWHEVGHYFGLNEAQIRALG